MRVKVVLQKVYVAFVLLVLLTIQVSMPVVNATRTIDGSVRTFGFNNPTEISNIVIIGSGNTAIASGIGSNSLSRTDDYEIQFDVFDLDGFDHLDVYVAFFNTNSSSKETTSGILIAAINSGVEDRGFVVRWMAPERSIYLSGLASGISEPYAFDINSGVSNFFVKSGVSPISSGTYNSGIVDFVSSGAFNLNNSVTWEVTSGANPVAVVSESGVVNDFSTSPSTSGVRNIKYTVTIPFKLSKVAPSSGVWNVGVMVHDRLQQEITEERTDVLVDKYAFAPNFYENQWYGEVSIVGSSGLRFTDVQAGSGFQKADQSGITSGIQARFISNGTYAQEVISDTTWRPAITVPNRPAFAYLVFSSGLEGSTATGDSQTRLEQEGNRFALQARRIQLGMAGDSFAEAATEDASFVDIFPDAPPANTDDLIPVKDLNGGIYQLADTTTKVPIDNPKPSEIAIISNAPGTDEIGVRSIFEFQLRLSAVFQNTEYSGNLSIGISNSSTPFTPQPE
jgi:hypothetical protein